MNPILRIKYFRLKKTQLNNKGFTLIELLVVISIIGLLASITLVTLSGVREKAKIGKVQLELLELHNAIELLYSDTELHPNGLSISPCVQNPEVFLDSCAAGLLCNDGRFPNWGGPYINFKPKDPWGTYYFFDPDFCCNGNVKGCEGITSPTWVRAIVSFGPNKTENYGVGCPYSGAQNSDDMVLMLCR